jgi:hypothetical protein
MSLWDTPDWLEATLDLPRQQAAELAPDAVSAGLPVLAEPDELADSGLVVGVVEAIWVAAPGATPGTVGAHLLAGARLGGSVLADIVWRGLQADVLGGVCAVAGAGEGDTTEFHAVRLGAREEACLAGARVLRCWEEPAPVLTGVASA